jgi:Ca-activated chloride channel family protein
MPKALWTVIAALALPALAPQTRMPTIHSSVDLVSLPVVVLAGDGEPVAGLTAGDFDIREGGVRQTIVSFAPAFSPTDVPLFLGLMLDKSISMERDLEAAAGAAIQFVNGFTDAEDVTLVEVERRVRLSRYSPASYPRLFERMREKTVGWGTAFYDAVARYVESTRPRDGIHVLVVYTDGGDSTSELNLSDAIHLLRGGRVWLYAIGYMDHTGAGRFLQQSILQNLARETGGRSFFPGSTRELDAIYRAIRTEVAGRYMLGYVSSDTRRDGRFRKVEVRLTGDRRGLTLRARSGYLAPLADQ